MKENDSVHKIPQSTKKSPLSKTLKEIYQIEDTNLPKDSLTATTAKIPVKTQTFSLSKTFNENLETPKKEPSSIKIKRNYLAEKLKEEEMVRKEFAKLNLADKLSQLHKMYLEKKEEWLEMFKNLIKNDLDYEELNPKVLNNIGSTFLEHGKLWVLLLVIKNDKRTSLFEVIDFFNHSLFYVNKDKESLKEFFLSSILKFPEEEILRELKKKKFSDELEEVRDLKKELKILLDKPEILFSPESSKSSKRFKSASNSQSSQQSSVLSLNSVVKENNIDQINSKTAPKEFASQTFSTIKKPDNKDGSLANDTFINPIFSPNPMVQNDISII